MVANRTPRVKHGPRARAAMALLWAPDDRTRSPRVVAAADRGRAGGRPDGMGAGGRPQSGPPWRGNERGDACRVERCSSKWASTMRGSGAPASRRSGGPRSCTTLRFGLLDGVELRLDGEPIVGLRGAEDATNVGDIVLGAKLRLLEGGGGPAAPDAVGPSLGEASHRAGPDRHPSAPTSCSSGSRRSISAA